MEEIPSFEEFKKKIEEKARRDNAIRKVHQGLRYIEGYLQDYVIEKKVVPYEDKVVGTIIVFFKPPEKEKSEEKKEIEEE